MSMRAMGSVMTRTMGARVKRIVGVAALALGAALTLSACSTPAPSDPDNICSIFQEKDSWYAAAHKVHDKYGVPIHVAMAIMAQESGFKADAEESSLFLFGGADKGSTASGYAKAQDDIWELYLDEEGSMMMISDRQDFADSLDFIGWYMVKTKTLNGVPLSDAYNQYLNYHEGWAGYREESYSTKSWLINNARDVAQKAELYKQQLLRCQLY